MIREDVADVLRLAAVETYERLRRDRRQAPEDFAPLFRCLEAHLFDRDFGAQVAWSRSGVSRAPFPLDAPLAVYLEKLRVDTARRMLELGDGRLPAGRIAAAVGLAGYRTWRRTFRRRTGENPPLIRRPERLEPEFDDLGWHHAWRGTLSVDDVRVLLKRLRHLGSRGVSPKAHGPTPPGRRGEISMEDARATLEEAAVPSRKRLLAEVEGLPDSIRIVLEYLVENLFDPGFSVAKCRERTGVPDTAISSRIRFYLGDSLIDLLNKCRVETAMRLAADLRFKVDRIAEEVGWSFRRLIRKCERHAGATVGEVRKTLAKSSRDPVYRLWCRAGLGVLSPADKLALEDFLRQLHPQVLAPSAGSLAVRTDVEPRRVAEVLELYRAIPDVETAALEALDRALRTHSDYSTAHWYCHWIRDRLGRASLDGAWEDWLTVNQDLEELLRQPEDQRAELVREVRKFQTDAFLWLLVDCVEVRLFHDCAESEHFADLAVAASKARWSVDRSPKSAGFRGLSLALKANADRRRNKLDRASEVFENALAAVRSVEVEPWLVGRIHSLRASLKKRSGEARSALRALFIASSSFKQAGDDLQRLRCSMDRAAAWFSLGRDPTRLLSACIKIFTKLPVAEELNRTAHLNRIQASIYLADRLSGSNLAEIRRFRSCMPPASSAHTVAEYDQVDGLIAALANEPHIAANKLKHAAIWFEDHMLKADAAVCWLQYSWATLSLDNANAKQAALIACAYVEITSPANQGLRRVALRIHHEALQGELSRDLLRWGILRIVSSRRELGPGEAEL